MQEASRGRAEPGEKEWANVEVGVARSQEKWSARERGIKRVPDLYQDKCRRWGVLSLVRFESKPPPCRNSLFMAHGTGARYGE